MQNIRISLDLTKIEGCRIIRANNSGNTPTEYVAIPVRACYVPADAPRPYLMATMIHCPNAKYGDFMVKPYLSGEDYAQMSAEERAATPIIGKGTFMQAAVSKQIAKAAEDVEVTDIIPTVSPQYSENPTCPAAQPAATAGAQRVRNPGLAAPLGSAPSQRAALPNETAAPGTAYFVRVPGGYSEGFQSFSEAAFYAEQDLANRGAIELWDGKVCLKRYHYHNEDFTWVAS